MLSAVVVLLQAKRCAGFDPNSFDLEALPHVNAVVPAPGAGHLAVQGGLRALAGLECGYHGFDALCMAACCHQQGVRRVDDDQVVRTQCHYRAVRGMNIGMAGIDSQALALYAVAVLVGGSEVGHGVPAAHIAPGAAKWHDGYIGVMLHHCVVDAFRTTGCEGRMLRADELLILHGASHCLLAAGQDVRRVRLQCFEQGCSFAQKNACIPQHVALQD